MMNLPQNDRLAERFWFLRRPVQLMADIAVLSGAFLFAYLLRFEFEIGEYYFDNALNQLPFVVFVQFVSLFLFGAYSIIWRYVSLDDIRAFLKAALVSGVILVLIRLLVSNDQFSRWQVPLSIILYDTGIAFAGLLALRLLRRFAYELGEKRTFQKVKRRFKPKATLFVGAGRIGALRFETFWDAPTRNSMSKVSLTTTGAKKAAASAALKF